MRVNSNIQNAIRALQAGRLEDARSLLNELCRGDPGDSEAWFLLGTVNGRLGNMD